MKDEDKVVAYALTALKESETFYPDLKVMFHNLETMEYKNKPLSFYRFYCMGKFESLLSL